MGGYADINRLHSWNLDFVDKTDEDSRYRTFAEKVEESLLFVRAVGIDTGVDAFRKVDLYTARRCNDSLLYEQALTRRGSTTGGWYDCSAQMLFLGQPDDEAVLEYTRGISNPLGIRVGEETTPKDILNVIIRINSIGERGKLTFVVRKGANQI